MLQLPTARTAHIPPISRLPVPWKQGEHLAIIGDTGTGKTTLAAALLTTQPYSVSLKTKADRTQLPGKRIKRVQGLDDGRESAFIFAPDYDDQATEIDRLLERLWREGGWTVYIDELWYVTGLSGAIRQKIDRLLTQGRSKGLTIVLGMQRPVTITRFAISQASHVISFRLEGRDAKTLSEATSPRLRDVVTSLDRYYWTWFYRPERRILRGTLDDLTEVTG